MRMWMLPPAKLCRKHLLGEHNELHMLAGSLMKGKSLAGFIRNGLLEPAQIRARHDELAEAMRARGYNHASPLPEYEAALARYPAEVREATVDVAQSAEDLRARCADCATRLQTDAAP